MGHIFDLEFPALHVGNSRAHSPLANQLRPKPSPFEKLNCTWGDRPREPLEKRCDCSCTGTWGRSPHLSCQTPRNRNSSIEAETPIVPNAVANGVWREASFWLGEMLPRKWIAELAERADVIYAHNPRFRKLVRGNSGRDWLWAFTRHWLAGLLIEHRPSLAARLPSGYQIGHPFSAPQATH